MKRPHPTPLLQSGLPEASEPVTLGGELARGFWRVALLNAFIAIVLWAAGNGPLDAEMVYSQAIGLSIWLFVQIGRYALGYATQPSGFPKGWRALALIGAGIVGGWVVGTAVGSLYVGESLWAMLRLSPRMVGSLFLMTVGIGSMATYYFYVEGKAADLERELERSQRQAAQAQLSLLQSQLEPHMLFNTLANLRVLIVADPAKAVQMLDRFNDYLRATLNASRASSHSLSAEFEHLRDYLELMQIRMGARLRIVLDLPDALRELALPPLLLQPLVENSIKHGLEPSLDGGEVSVRATLESDQLRLEVTDTGAGLPAAQNRRSGFGLTQVRERLATVYGGRARFEISDHEPTGTRAVITLPLIP